MFYIVVLGLSSIQDAKKLIAIGSQANYFKERAYYDQLTGIKNRNAYADYVGSDQFRPKDHAIVMLDLNNLKYCNDTFGHEKGDLYIKSSAKLIQDVFGASGECYRMGGDEFCAILAVPSEEGCEQLMQSLKEQVQQWNQMHEEPFEMRVACGCAVYDEEKDFDIGDTLRRADKKMYLEKFAMKKSKV